MSHKVQQVELSAACDKDKIAEKFRVAGPYN